LTHRSESARGADIDNTTARSGSETKNARGIDVGESQHCMKQLRRRHFFYSCCERSSSNRALRESPARPEARCVDSESQVLAMKKFSCLTTSRLTPTRQSRIFLRIANRRFATSESDGSDRSLPARTFGNARASRSGDAAATVLTRSDTELGLEQVVDSLRIGLAAGRLHHLADEPLNCRWLGLGLGDLVRIGGDDVVDHLFDRA
jgi:hypothetical protein